MYTESARRRSWLLKAALGLFALLAAFMGLKTTSADHLPDPIDPDSGEANLLDLINSLPLNTVQQALDNFPVPYVVVATADGAAPTVVNKNAGSPVRIDADRSKATGKGGDDIQVEVNTELLPSPHLRVNINRITSPSDATDVQVLVAFPFQAFNDEPALTSPNLFIGYQTHAVGGGPGGIAPLNEEFRIIPGTLDGTSHEFTLQMNTTGPSNPMTFIAGHFDGTAADGIENALGMQAYVESVPASIEIGFDVDQTLITTPGLTSNSQVGLTWDATSETYVEFTYFEEEDFPIAGDTDYGTTLAFDLMPTEEELSLTYDNSAGTGGTLTVGHSANAVVDEIILTYHREDGLTITGIARDVPTSMDIGIDFAGSATLTVNENLGELLVQVVQEGGFLDTADFLGYNIGYAEFGVADAPSLTAGYNSTDNSFGVAVTELGTDIGAVWLVIGDDHNLELPPSWGDVPTHHIFSLVDDGTHGTAAARVVNLIQATLYLDASPTGETFAFELRDDAPMQLYLETAADSDLTGEDIKVTCDIDNMPYGEVDFTIDFPDQFAVSADPIPGYPETNDAASFVINSIVCSGNIGTLNFELGVGSLPMNSGYIFDPSGLLQVKSEPTGPNTGTIGFISAHFWVDTNPLPSSQGLAVLLGDDLHDARMRADSIPSFVGTWSDSPGTLISFDTGIPNVVKYLGGVQVAVSTAVDLLSDLTPAAAGSDHYLRFADGGAAQPKSLKAGAFGIDAISFNSNDGAGSMTMHYASNANHKLVIDVDSTFGGEYFPTYDIDLVMVVDAIPATFDMTTNMSTQFNYTSSAGISSITIDGTIDNSGPDLTDQTTIDFDATGLPQTVSFALDPAKGATLNMNAAITQVSLELSSSVGILGSPYQLIRGGLNNIPAKWNINWESGGFLVESKDAADNPSPMGSVTGLISTSKDGPTNDAKIAPLTLDGPNLAGVITGGDSGCRVDYSEFLQEIDRRYYDVGAPSVKSRLDELYCGSEQLDPGEDHAVALMVGGSLDFASLKFTGFQKIQYAPDANGGHYELKVPTPGLHPFFVGVGLDSNFATLQLANIPDSMVLDIDTAAGLITYDAADDVDPSVGEIDVYYGPLPVANDGSTAVRAILRQTPSFVHIKWDLGFPNGDAWFDASNEFELLFLAQSGSKRVTGGMAMEDLHLHYGIEGPGYSPCDEVLGADTCYGLLRATAGIDNDADGFASTLAINGTKADLAAFIAVYDLIGGPAALTGSCPGTCPGPVGNEYVPLVTAATKDFRGVILVFEIQFDPLLPTSDFWPIDFEYNPTGPDGQVVVDVWDQGFSVSFAGFDLTNDPDYIDNNPWHIIPVTTLTTAGLHTFSDHDFDPFGP